MTARIVKKKPEINRFKRIRERKQAAGMRATQVWFYPETRPMLVALRRACNETISDLVNRLVREEAARHFK